MAYMITAECINCSACQLDCPVRAITPGPSQFHIHPDVCVECDGYYPVPRCRWVCPVNACVPSRESYLFKARALAHRGAPPVVLRAAPAAPAAPSTELLERLERLEKQLTLVTNKETRAELRYAMAQIQWQLGQITDAEFAEIEKFYESFTYEWC
jgi:hypothetical protein